jgi:hypothetical protein
LALVVRVQRGKFLFQDFNTQSLYFSSLAAKINADSRSKKIRLPPEISP